MQKYFKDTYQISNRRIYNNCYEKQVSFLSGRRGRHVSDNKIDDTHVIKLINSFPAYTSHYTRANNSERKYLTPDLNIRKMYELYVAQL